MRFHAALATAIVLLVGSAGPAPARKRSGPPRQLTAGEARELAGALLPLVEARARVVERTEVRLPSRDAVTAVTWVDDGRLGLLALTPDHVLASDALRQGEGPCAELVPVAHAVAHGELGHLAWQLSNAHGADRLLGAVRDGDDGVLAGIAANLATGGSLGWHGPLAEDAARERAESLLEGAGCETEGAAFVAALGEGPRNLQRAHPDMPRRRGKR